MNTLVIHPRDDTTVFLNKVYEGIEDVTLVQGGVPKATLKDMVCTHDQVMMMGHGSGAGLWSVGQFPDAPGFIVDDSFVDLLAEKDNSVFIWCNADRFVTANELKGFYTGMFISEVMEADLMGLVGTTQTEVDESNHLFVETVSQVASTGAALMHAAAKTGYKSLVHRNAVAKYNNERLFIN